MNLLVLPELLPRLSINQAPGKELRLLTKIMQIKNQPLKLLASFPFLRMICKYDTELTSHEKGLGLLLVRKIHLYFLDNSVETLSS